MPWRGGAIPGDATMLSAQLLDAADRISRRGPSARRRPDPRHVRAFRLVCLRDTYRYARSECSYYASYPDIDIERFSDLEELPMLERRQIAPDIDAVCARACKPDFFYSTSGTSSGQSLYIPRASCETEAIAAYGAPRSTAPRTGKTLRLKPSGRLMAGGSGSANEVVFVYHNNMARENLWDNWDTLIQQLFAKYPTGAGFGPIDSIHATPPYALSLLTRLMQQRGIDPRMTDVRRLFVTGAHISTHRRRMLETAWNASIATTYSCAELNHAARECRKRPKHYHFDAITHIEVVDPDTGRHVDVGESGRVLLTGLFPFHQASMFLRYAVGDWARWLGEDECECGVFAPTIELLGRERDCIPLTIGTRTHRISSARTLEALERFDAIPAVPRPQFRWRLPEGGARTLTLDVELFALAAPEWLRTQRRAVEEALREQHEWLGPALDARELELEIEFHPRSALSVLLPVR